MGRPEGSPRMNSNFNPMFHAQPAPAPEPPVEEKWVVEADQNYPNIGGMVNQPNSVPMGIPAQPTYHNNGGMASQPNTVPMGGPAQPTYHNHGGMGNQPNRVPMGGPTQPTYHNHGGMGNPHSGIPMARAAVNQPSNWTSGLFDCMNDCDNAIITCCFPFVTFGQIAEIIDEGATSCGTGGMMYVLICWCLWMPFLYSCTYRTKLRSKYGLPDAPAPDWITHCFCEWCALCQEYRELNNRGLDPTIGWIGNVQKQRMLQQQEMMAPPMGQRMMG